MNYLSEEKRAKLSEVLFYVALTIELGIMLLEKSDIDRTTLSFGSLSFDTCLFYVTFAVSFLAVLIMKHDKKEWMILGAILVFVIICWRITRRNDLLRYTVFLMAAKNIDVKKVMKYIFYVSAAGFCLTVLLACSNVLGDIALPLQDYGRDGKELRYVFGFGHPNTFYGCVYSLVLLWIWIYGEKSSLKKWMIVFFINICACVLTKSRTAMLISILTFAVGFLAKVIKDFREKKIVYVSTAVVTPFLCVLFSVFAAIFCYMEKYEQSKKLYDVIFWLNDKLTDRISNLYYDSSSHAGYIKTWKLFSDRASDRDFDMGWVKLFYECGIVPGIAIAAIVALLIYICYKKKDIWTLIIILSLSIYTVVEATFVSRYIGRLFILPVVGVYLGEFVRGKGIENNV